MLPRDLLLREIARTLTLVREPEGARRGNEIQPSPLFAVIFSRLDKDPRRPHASIVARPTNEGGVAVGGERDGGALRCIASSPRADQFAALLGPDIVAAGVDPGRAHRGGKDAPWPAHDGGVTVGGQRDGGAPCRASLPVPVPSSTLCWVRPNPIAPGEDPCPPRSDNVALRARSAHDGGIAIG